jgi:hypothetical protein
VRTEPSLPGIVALSGVWGDAAESCLGPTAWRQGRTELNFLLLPQASVHMTDAVQALEVWKLTWRVHEGSMILSVAFHGFPRS